MSTYTDLHTRRRENLTILRQPGTAEDGITPQRVIFANPENIYEGTFKGKIEAVGVSFTSVDLTDVTINGGKIKDATIYSEGREVSIADLTSDVSEISGKLDEAIENITSIQLSCGALDKKIGDVISGDSGIQKISVDLVNAVSSLVDNSLSTLSSELCGIVDSRLLSTETMLLSQVSSVSSLLSSGLDNEASSRVGSDIAISAQLDAISTRIETNEQAFDQHVQDNNETFNFLSNYLLSSLEHDRHYAIIDDFKEIPYRVKEFAVNVIDAGASNVEIKYGGTVIGYGTYVEDGDGTTKLRVAITTDDKIPALINAIPGTYNADLKEGSANRQAIGGAYFYYITWLSASNTIKLNKIDQEYYDLVETSYNTTVGKIKNALVDNEGQFISGTIMFQQTGTEFDAFYNALSNGVVFDNAELSSTLMNGCQVKLNADHKTFSLGRDIETKEIREIVDNTDDHTVFGRVVVTDVSVDQGSIVKIPVTGIDLTKYGIIKHSRAVDLNEDNGFYGKISDSLVVSCDVESGNIFSVVQTKEKFAYPYYKPTSIGQHQLSDAIGYLIPDQVNTPINGGVFTKLSIETEAVDWSAETVVLKTHECLSTSYNTYTCQEGTIGDYDSGWMTITAVKDVDTTWAVSLDGYDGVRGVEIKATYKVDTSLYAVVPEAGTYTLIAQSTPTNVLEGEEKTFPEASYTAVANGPKPVTGETEIDLALHNAEGNLLQIQIPTKDSKYFDTAREFIIATRIASTDEKIHLKLVDGLSEVEYYANGERDGAWVPANKWSAWRVIEVDQDKFLVEDLDNVYLRDQIAQTNDALAEEMAQREVDDAFLSSKIDSNKEEIDDLWKNIRGGLNYIDNLSVGNFGCETIYDYLIWNSQKGVKVPALLREGFFYVIQTPDKNVHYSIESLEVEHGDWLIIKNNTPLAEIAISDVAVFDAQDYDTFRLSGDNNAVGNNTFTGATTLSGATSIDGALTVSASTQFIDGTLTEFNGKTVFAGDLSAAKLSIELEDIKYGNGLCSLGELTSDLQDQLASAQISIDTLDKGLTKLSGEVSAVYDSINYLSSELSDYHSTLSGIDRGFDETGDIKSDNLIITDVNLPGGTVHSHSQYYMTFISGTVVLKPIA